ncbi:acyl dehydratase [Neobacillus niacini]|uniref:MaoC/PaaZ C-terminal domain-containing protein n=1 Tax=Neobacillus niacini TaxID=86668 RepID=UPI00277F38C9|nr:MaoC/PaaZ C-terminal domain-containing protein [Neobacillus niacini]MDQ1002235.1 acyl dehydratase [Neobacillus niacini]
MIPFNELKIGLDLGPLIKPPIEKVDLVKYCGVAQDFHLIHTDDELARKDGLPGVIAHGMLSMGYLCQLVGQLVETKGFIRRLQVRFTGMVFPGDIITCRAKVININENTRTVELEVTAETSNGKIVSIGESTLIYY